MDNQQAIEVLKDFDKQVSEKEDGTYQSTIGKMACNLAISALGKQIPQKAIFEINYGDYESRFACACGKRIVVRHNRGVMDNHDAPNFCPNCGQRLDWSE